MDFTFANIGTENFYSGEFNSITFSLSGMMLVFAGLTIISLYIVFLPKLLHLLERKKTTAPHGQEGFEQEADREKELLLAIATAFYLDRNFPEENQKITWKSHGDVESPWQISGRVQGMSQRTHVSRRVFPHH